MQHPLTQTLDLVRKAQTGDGDAMNRLFERYYERVRHPVRKRIGPRLRSRLDSDDILQHAFGKAFENFDRFEMRDEGSFLHWLVEIAEHQVRDAIDRENAKKRTPPAGLVSLDDAGDASGGPIEVAARATGPIDRVAKAERKAVMDECIDLLPEHYRTVIALRRLDLEWQEIARRLDKKTASAARELHERALLMLRELLQRRGIGPETP